MYRRIGYVSMYRLCSGVVFKYRRAHPFNLPAQPFNLSISDKLWTLEKNKGHFIILELNSGIIKWPLFFSKVNSLSDIDRLKGCAGRLKGCALRYNVLKTEQRC